MLTVEDSMPLRYVANNTGFTAFVNLPKLTLNFKAGTTFMSLTVFLNATYTKK